MFDGYLALGSTELINAERTRAYVRKNLPAFPLRAVKKGDLALALGDDEYESPLVDDAPWVDVLNPATHGFFGLYPLSIEGVDDSTLTAPIQEGVNDGGVIGAPRHSARQIRVHGLLLAADELALDAGMTWLRAALNPAPCLDGSCGEGRLSYFAAPPEIVEKYDYRYGMGDIIPLTNVTPNNSPASFLVPDHDQRVWAEWLDFEGDGAVVRYGAMGSGSSEIIEEHGPVVPHRTNFALNPSFTRGTSSWTPTGPASTARLLTGGVDDGPFLRRSPNVPALVRTNWVVNPSLEYGDPQQGGWITNGDLTRELDATAPQGGYVAVAQQLAGQETLWVEVPVLGPAVSTLGGASFDIGAIAEGVVATLFSLANEPVASQTYPAGSLSLPWQRRSFAGIVGEGYRLRIETVSAATSPLRLDALMVGASTGTYFDGDTPDAGDTYAWTRTPDNSPSTWLSQVDGSTTVNLVPNPRAATTTGATLATSYGVRPLVLGFNRDPSSLGWQSTARVFRGNAALAIEWTDEPYPNTFYPDDKYPA